MPLMPQEAIITIAAVMGGLAVILGGIVSIYRIATRIDQALALDEEGRTVSERMSRVEHQLWKNGGDSLADEVGLTHQIAVETATEVRLMKDILLTLIGQVPESAPARRRKPRAATSFALKTFDKED
jgi:hypothetical protein